MNTDFLARQLRIGRRRDVVLIGGLIGAMLVGFLAYIARVNSVTPDAFHEMSLVREWYRTGEFPRNDVWAYSPTVQPTVHHEWATGLALYWSAATSPLREQGLMALRLSLIAMIWLVLYRVARNAGCHPVIFAILAPVTFPFFWVGFGTVRAQLFTLLFLSIQMLMLQSDWRGKRWWIAPWCVMFLLWLNMHAGFIVGGALFLWHVVERTIDHLARYGILDAGQPWNLRRARFAKFDSKKAFQQLGYLFFLIPVLVLLTTWNPWGTDYWFYLYRAITMPRPSITEWKPLWHTHSPLTSLLAYGVASMLLLYGMASRPWKRWRMVPFCLLAAMAGVQHIRHGSLYGVLWIGIVPALVSATPLGKSIVAWINSRRREVITVAALSASICAAFAVSLPFWKVQLPTSLADGKSAYPVGAVRYLGKHNFEGNVMTPFASGAFVSWHLYPKVQVSLDGRYEVAYQPEVFPDHERIYNAKPGWKELLPNYASDVVLIHRLDPLGAIVMRNADQRADYAIHGLPGWRLCYVDDTYMIVCRNDVQLPHEDARRAKIFLPSDALAGGPSTQ